jgi:hypothetical protein
MSGEVVEPPAPLDLAWEVEREIVRRTWRQVNHLEVELRSGRVVVRGAARSYYVKQLAIQACLDTLAAVGPRPLEVEITVISGDGPHTV